MSNIKRKKVSKDKVTEKHQERIRYLEREVSKLKKAIIESENKFTELSEMAHEIVFIINKGFKVQYLNSFGARLLGKNPEDIIGKQLNSIFPAVLLIKVKRTIKKVFEEEKPLYIELDVLLKDKELWLGCWFVPLRDEKDKTGSVLGICRDLTQRKKAEEALRFSELQYHMTLDSIADAIYVVNDELKIALFNQALKNWNKLLGLETDILGKTIFKVYKFLPKSIREEYQKVFTEGKPLITEEIFKIGDREFITEMKKIPIFEKEKVVSVVTVIRDITEQRYEERKKTLLQRQLENAMRDLETVFNNIDVLLWSVREDEDGELYYEQVNEPFAAVESFTPEHYNGKRISDIASPEQLQTIKNSFAWMKLGKPYLYDVQFGGGENKRHFIIRLIPFIEEDGQVHRFIGSAVDITERKKVEDALRESEERYRAFTEEAMVGVYIYRENRFLYINKEMEKITGYSQDELLKIDTGKIVYSEDSEYLKEREEARDRGDSISPQYTMRIVRKNGEVGVIEVRTRPIQYISKKAYLGNCIDITDKMRSEEALKMSEANYRAIYNAVNDAIIIRDKDTGNIIDANQKACEMFGYTVEELRNLHLSVENLSAGRPPYTQKDAIEWIKKAAKGEPQLFEWWSKDKKGRLFWTENNLRIANIGGKECLVSILRDITERKRSEKIQSAIYMISEAVSTTENLPELYQSIHKILGELMRADNFYIALYDHTTEIISFPYYIDEFTETPTSRKKGGRGLTEYVLRTGKPLHASPDVFEDLLNKGEFELYGPPCVDWIGVPLKIKDRTIGVLTVQSYKEDIRFGDEELDILMFVSTQIAMAIERKKAEEALKGSEEFSRAIIENSPVGITVRSRTGQLISFNEAWKKIWALSDDEVEKYQKERNMLEFDEKDSYLGKYISKVKRIYESGGELFISELKTKSDKQGAAKWISHYFYALKNEDGEVDRVVILTEDITEQRETERSLAESEEKYRTLVEQATDGVIIIQDSLFMFVNSAFCKIIGYEKDELLGTPFIPYIVPSERERISDIYRKRLEGENVPSIYETVGIHKSGTEIPIELNAALTQYMGKTATLVILRDISERKRAEQELMKALEDLERAHSELKKLDAVKTEFLNITSHELRSPLTSILGYAELLNDGLLGSITDAQKEAIYGVLRNSQQLSRLVEDLLDFTSMEAGALRLDLRPCKISSILIDAVDSMKSIIEEAGCKIDLDMPQDLPVVKGDTERIIQVIYNLIDNALKFSPEGGNIKVGAREVTDYVEVYVKDEGIGISQEEKDKIFDKFYQIDMSDKRRVRGIGLGLAISKAIIEASGGSIWMDSEIGKGSTFKFTLSVYRK